MTTGLDTLVNVCITHTQTHTRT